MSKLPPVREQEGRDAARGRRSMSNTNPPRYRCIACGRSRSSTYHSRHPPEEPPPPPGVCRRCIDKEQEERLPPYPEITIYKIHHYLHGCTCQHERSFASTAMELPVSPAYPACAKLLAEDSKDRSPAPRQLLERVPPPVAFWNKPGKQSL
jgi:hypothetical protein